MDNKSDITNYIKSDIESDVKSNIVSDIKSNIKSDVKSENYDNDDDLNGTAYKTTSIN